MKVTEHGSAKVTDEAIIGVLRKEADLDVTISYDLNEEVALEGLREKTVDMVIIPSNTIVKDDDPPVRTLMPLLPRVLMVLTRSGIEEGKLKDLVEKHPVFYEDMSSMDVLFFKKLFVTMGIDPDEVSARMIDHEHDGVDSAAVYVGLTHLHNPLVMSLLDRGWSLFSLDEVSALGHGSSVEGIQMTFPWAHPFVLPRSFHEGKPVKPVLTVAIRDVLVSRSDFDAQTAYHVVRALMENRASLIRENGIYNLLPVELDRGNLSFPFQKGALYYLDRDQPSVWVRYANTMWPILSVIALVVGGLASFRNHLRRARTQRIGTYYSDLIRIRSKTIYGTGDTAQEDLLDELLRIRNRAFDALHKKKLNADESFSIFLELYQEISEEIRQRLKKG